MADVEEVAPVKQETTKKTVEVDEEYIKTVLNIVNVVSNRGGFRPGEFKIVGHVFEHLSALVPEKKDD